jgi:predicted ABC-type exoprotein transport system permease subunit
MLFPRRVNQYIRNCGSLLCAALSIVAIYNSFQSIIINTATLIRLAVLGIMNFGGQCL